MNPEIVLNDDQKKVVDWTDAAMRDKNPAVAFITGPGGVGKSLIIEEINNRHPGEVLITTLVGKNAIAIKGKTLHSAFHIPVNDSWVKPLEVGALAANKVLVIDEACLLDLFFLEEIDAICKHVNNNGLPFGGFLTLLFGDLLQLPPIKSQKATTLKYVFQYEHWNSVKIFMLTKNGSLRGS